jgi:hypothetical protein
MYFTNELLTIILYIITITTCRSGTTLSIHVERNKQHFRQHSLLYYNFYNVMRRETETNYCRHTTHLHVHVHTTPLYPLSLHTLRKRTREVQYHHQ